MEKRMTQTQTQERTGFDAFSLAPPCADVLEEQGIIDPTPIQERAIPPILEGRDIMGVAQTGTGKTLAFVLPALSRLVRGRVRRNMMLVLTPTRELADQVYEVVEQFAEVLDLSTTCIYGGVGYEPQKKDLRRGSAIIVATPGRLLDHMKQGHIDFRNLKTLVLDEADRMLDMGFLPDIRRIVQELPRKRQTLMFSATFAPEIQSLAGDMMYEPERIEVGAVHKPVESVRQELYSVQSDEKVALLTSLLKEREVDSAMVFIRTKGRTERVAKMLRRNGVKAEAIHGDRTQKQRQKALDGFRTGTFPVLVATDVAARGLDIGGVSHVFNFDIPATPDDYLHRIGRTARAQAKGEAVTFVQPDEHLALEAIERALGYNIPDADWEGQTNVLRLFSPESKDDKRRKSGQRRRARGMLRRR
jgi:ATP-dependent RNA helicase RhlE